MSNARIVQIEVHGQTYPIKTTLDPAYVHDLAAFVEQRMRLAAETAPASDVVGLAVLTALNIADEYFRSRSVTETDQGALAARAEELERIVDQALELAR